MKYKVRPGVVAASVCDSHFLVTADMTIRINETVAYYWESFRKVRTRTPLSHGQMKDMRPKMNWFFEPTSGS